MSLLASRTLEQIAYEGFIRRASALELPFMLKGSYVTRQYFPNPHDRIPNDLDWVYMLRVENAAEAKLRFDDWAIQATENWQNDGVVFKSFRENAFWRMLDYAMAEDFPTVNTDLLCSVHGQASDDLALDVSFNLPLDVPSVPLLYRPLQGEPFTVPHTTPLSLQVAWKLHQTLIRPRFKDLFDLIYLLRHPAFDQAAKQQTMQALEKECRADNTDISRLRWLVGGDLHRLYSKPPVGDAWNVWRHSQRQKSDYLFHYSERAEFITTAENLPEKLADFQQQIQESFTQVGFDKLLSSLSYDTKKASFLDTLLNFFR
jgi:hypothetical protein